LRLKEEKNKREIKRILVETKIIGEGRNPTQDHLIISIAK
jgi:hypothetical protein